MVTLDNVYEILMAILPSITAVLSAVGVAIGILAKFKALRKDVADKTDLSEYKEQIKQISEEDKATIQQLVQQNAELQTQIAELVSKIDKIRKNTKKGE